MSLKSSRYLLIALERRKIQFEITVEAIDAYVDRTGWTRDQISNEPNVFS